MNQLDILLPFGLPPTELATDLIKNLDAPALATLISRAKSDSGLRHETFEGFFRSLPHETWLSRQFGMGEELDRGGSPPIATALMRSFGLQPQSGTWFVLQPVHIHIARDHLVLTDPRQLMLSEIDAQTLFNIAKPLFEEIDQELVYGNAGTWFLRAEGWNELQTSTPDASAGHNIDLWMPKGPHERAWRKIQNEVQMHWYGHAVNASREDQGLKPVNSLWLWGGASAAGPTGSRFAGGYNLTGWMQAFAPLVSHHAVLASANAFNNEQVDTGLLVLDDLLASALSNDWATWLSAMHRLEVDWFAPLLEALKSGVIDQVSLTITHDSRISRFAATRSSLRKFWVKPSLATLCP